MKKASFEGLFLLLMNSHLIASGAIFFDFHFFRVLFLVASADVVFFATFGTLEDNIITHLYHSSIF